MVLDFTVGNFSLETETKATLSFITMISHNNNCKINTSSSFQIWMLNITVIIYMHEFIQKRRLILKKLKDWVQNESALIVFHDWKLG